VALSPRTMFGVPPGSTVEDICRNCLMLVQPGFEPYCCRRCSNTPGRHGPLCHRLYPPTECESCGLVGTDGWAGHEDYAKTWWCRGCWEPWLASNIACAADIKVPFYPLSHDGGSYTASPPVFVVGLPKCGTTSLQHALKSAGYGAVHCYAPKPWGPAPEDRFVGSLMARAVAEGKPPLALLPGWVNAITQMDCWWLEKGAPSGAVDQPLAGGHVTDSAHVIFPQITMLDRLDAAYPGAKFILNIRNSHRWLKSVSSYGSLRHILEEADLPGQPEPHALASVAGSEETLLAWFEAHTARVRAYFVDRRDDSFLEISLEDGDIFTSSKLEQFLGTPVDWGCHNKTTWAEAEPAQHSSRGVTINDEYIEAQRKSSDRCRTSRCAHALLSVLPAMRDQVSAGRFKKWCSGSAQRLRVCWQSFACVPKLAPRI